MGWKRMESRGKKWLLSSVSTSLSPEYANIDEYAQREVADAFEDFQEIVRDIHEIIKQLDEFKEAGKMSFKEMLAAAVLELAYDVLTSGRFTVAKEAVERGLDLLEAYVERELLPDLVNEVLEHIPEGPYKPLVTTMINTHVRADITDEELAEMVKEGTNEIFEEYYTKKASAGLYAVLEHARSYVPGGESHDDWERGMREDFYE